MPFSLLDAGLWAGHQAPAQLCSGNFNTSSRTSSHACDSTCGHCVAWHHASTLTPQLVRLKAKRLRRIRFTSETQQLPDSVSADLDSCSDGAALGCPAGCPATCKPRLAAWFDAKWLPTGNLPGCLTAWLLAVRLASFVHIEAGWIGPRQHSLPVA